MAQLGRRSFLGVLAAIGVVGTGRGLAAQPDLPEEVIARRRAITALRVLNTVQVRHYGSYLTLTEILASRRESLFKLNESAGYEVFAPDSPANGRDAVPGYQLVSHLSDDRKSYAYLLVSRSEPRSYRTDQNGVIFEGFVEVRAAQFVATDLEKHFVGSPIEIKERQRPAFGRVGRIMAAATGFFFPVVAAQSGSYCCNEVCFATCIRSDPANCSQVCNCSEIPYACCNTGFPICSWCCRNCDTCDNVECCYCLSYGCF